MKKLKYIVLFFIVLLSSGCSVEYEVNIDENKSVEDYLSIKFPSILSSTYFDTTREYIDYMYDVKTSEFGVSGYNKDYEIGNDFSIVNMNKTHGTIESYFNSGIIKRLYSNISITKDGDSIIINLTGMNDVFGVVNQYDGENQLDPFSIVLNSKYVIENDNADEKNVITGEYVWNFEPSAFGKTITFTVTDKINTGAVLNEKFGMYVLPVVVLAILGIGYIIYAVFKKRAAEVNSI